MIHLIRNEGIFDLFLSEDKKKLNEKLCRKDSLGSNEIRLPKKRGRKPRNYVELEKLQELEKTVKDEEILLNIDQEEKQKKIEVLNEMKKLYQLQNQPKKKKLFEIRKFYGRGKYKRNKNLNSYTEDEEDREEEGEGEIEDYHNNNNENYNDYSGIERNYSDNYVILINESE